MLRFMTAITARYNWQRDELTMGRAELARLWQVNERTVKRELAKLKACNWLRIKRPAARGRVTVYGVDWAQVLQDTEGAWAHVGPDFVLRAGELAGHPGGEIPDRKVVAFPRPATGDTEWDVVRAEMARDDPAFHANWLASVQRVGIAAGVLELQAPSAFHAQYLNAQAGARLLASVQRVAPQVHRVVIRPPSG
jgi:Mn-dependent DtxR family transcriptional regulator